jgi:hypothetical protein
MVTEEPLEQGIRKALGDSHLHSELPYRHWAKLSFPHSWITSLVENLLRHDSFGNFGDRPGHLN